MKRLLLSMLIMHAAVVVCTENHISTQDLIDQLEQIIHEDDDLNPVVATRALHDLNEQVQQDATLTTDQQECLLQKIADLSFYLQALETVQTRGLPSTNAAVGKLSLYNLESGIDNSTLGYHAGQFLTAGTNNILIGSNAGINYAGAESNNIVVGNGGTAGDNGIIRIGDPSIHNIALGANTLTNVTTGSANIAIGNNSASALAAGDGNTFIGAYAGSTITSGNYNTIIGYQPQLNGTGDNNIIIGANIVITASSNSTYIGNIATTPLDGLPVVITSEGQLGIGSPLPAIAGGDRFYALVQRDGTGSFAATTVTLTGNSLINYSANGDGSGSASFILSPLDNNTVIGLDTVLPDGAGNIIVGAGAGLTDGGDNNIIIGTGLTVTQASNVTYIANISGATPFGSTSTVVINADGQLGSAIPSSARYKNNIQDLGDLSVDLYDLRPVSFRYKADSVVDYGLVAEEVATSMPVLTGYKNGVPETVRYDRLPIFMLNEQQKDHAELLNLRSHVAQLEQMVLALGKKIETLGK